MCWGDLADAGPCRYRVGRASGDRPPRPGGRLEYCRGADKPNAAVQLSHSARRRAWRPGVLGRGSSRAAAGGRGGRSHRSAPSLAERAGASSSGGVPEPGRPVAGPVVIARALPAEPPSGGNAVETSTIARNRFGTFAAVFDHRVSRRIPIGMDRWDRSKTLDRSRCGCRRSSIMTSRSGTLHVPVRRYNRSGRTVAFLLAPDGSVSSACPAPEIGMIGNRAQSISRRPGRVRRPGGIAGVARTWGPPANAGFSGDDGRCRLDRQCWPPATTELVPGWPVNCFPSVSPRRRVCASRLVVVAISSAAPIGSP